MKNLENNIKAFTYSVSPLIFAMFSVYMVYLTYGILYNKCP